MRVSQRFHTNAFFHLQDSAGNRTEANMCNISDHGLSIICEKILDFEVHSIYEILVVPEKVTKVEKFKLRIESRWVMLTKSIMKYGFAIVAAHDEGEFKKYLHYLAEKNVAAAAKDHHGKQPANTLGFRSAV